jgi:hypothetical protein
MWCSFTLLNLNICSILCLEGFIIVECKTYATLSRRV